LRENQRESPCILAIFGGRVEAARLAATGGLQEEF